MSATEQQQPLVELPRDCQPRRWDHRDKVALEAAHRIERLEAALRLIADTYWDRAAGHIARRALRLED